MATVISSLTNDRIKDLVRLRKRRHRDHRQLIIVEEPLVIKRGFDADIAYREIYYCPDNLQSDTRALLANLLAIPRIQTFELSAPVMAKVAYRDQPQGLLALATPQQHSLDSLTWPAGEQALFVVLEGVEKPGNLGAIQRVADGAGAHGIIACGGGVDIGNPNALRASRGACFSLPTVQTGTAEALAWLRAREIPMVASSPQAPDSFTQIDLTGPVAILLGTEHEGLSPEMLAAADRVAAIPMLGRGDSLNVSTSAAVLLYEAVRQRSRTRKVT